jgi:hypothetical protein
VLHHVADPLAVLEEMKRVSNSYIIVLEPNRNNPLVYSFSLVKKEERGGLKFTMSYLKGAMVKCGLKPVFSRPYCLVMPNMTPAPLAGVLKMVDNIGPLSLFNVVIARK